MKNGRCPNCGSKVVMAGVEVRDDGKSSTHPLRVVIEEPEPVKHGRVWVQPRINRGAARLDLRNLWLYRALYK